MAQPSPATWDGYTRVLIRSRKAHRSRGRADPSARMSRALHSLASFSLFLPSCLRAAGGTCAVGAGGIGTWAGDPAGTPCADTFWRSKMGPDGVPRHANLAEPVPWSQASSWPLDVTPKAPRHQRHTYTPSDPLQSCLPAGWEQGSASAVFRGPIRAFREPDGHASLLFGR